MLLDIPVEADFQLLQRGRQSMVDRDLARANQKRVSIDCQPGDEVLKLVYKPNKLDPRAIGPYVVEKVHCNGSLTVRISPLVTQRINIRQLCPYNEKLPVSHCNNNFCHLGLSWWSLVSFHRGRMQWWPQSCDESCCWLTGHPLAHLALQLNWAYVFYIIFMYINWASLVESLLQFYR